jgi:hypothetical protein
MGCPKNPQIDLAPVLSTPRTPQLLVASAGNKRSFRVKVKHPGQSCPIGLLGARCVLYLQNTVVTRSQMWQ